MDAATFIDKSRTYVPVRFLGNSLGVENENISYDGSNVVLIKDVKSLGLKIGDNQLTVDGKATAKMDVVPIIKEGRTYLPARFVAEAFGYQVDWDADTEMVRVFSNGVQLKPEIVYRVEKYLGAEMTYYVDSMDSKYNHWKYGSRRDNFIISTGDNDKEDISELSIGVFEYATEEDILKSYAVMWGLYPNNPEIVQKTQSILVKKRQQNDYDEKNEFVVNNQRIWVNTWWNDDTQLYDIIIFKRGK